MSKKYHYTYLLGAIVLVIWITLTVVNTNDFSARLRTKEFKKGKGSDINIVSLSVPKCKTTSINSITNETAPSFLNNDHVLETGLIAFENELLNIGGWNILIDEVLDNALIEDVNLVSIGFANNNADWTITRWAVNVIADQGGNLSRFGHSFLSEQSIGFISQSPFDLTVDVKLTNGNDYRIGLIFPTINVNLAYYADVNGTFDFKSGTLQNQNFLIGSAKEIFGETEPMTDTNWEGYEFDEMTMGFGDGFVVNSLLAVDDDGETSEPTDLITTAFLASFLENNNLSATGIFLGNHEGNEDYINNLITDAQINNILSGFKDAFGVMMGRKILADHGYVTNTDLVVAHWVEHGTYSEKAFLCDYGQSVSTKGFINPATIKPGVPYVEHGIDYNF